MMYNCHPHLPVVYPASINEALKTCQGGITVPPSYGGNAIRKKWAQMLQKATPALD
jgi:hypothetical protein